MPMKRRGFFASWALFAVTTGPAFGVVSTLLSDVASAWLGGSRPFDVASFVMRAALGGLLFGLLFGLVMAVFFRGIERTLRLSDSAHDRDRLRGELERIGYRPLVIEPTYWRLVPGFRAGILAGEVQVRFADQDALIVGPSKHVEHVIGRMRTSHDEPAAKFSASGPRART